MCPAQSQRCHSGTHSPISAHRDRALHNSPFFHSTGNKLKVNLFPAVVSAFVSLHFTAENFIPKEFVCRVVLVSSDRVPSCTSRAAGATHGLSQGISQGKPHTAASLAPLTAASSQSMAVLPAGPGYTQTWALHTDLGFTHTPDLFQLPFLPGLRGGAVPQGESHVPQQDLGCPALGSAHNLSHCPCTPHSSKPPTPHQAPLCGDRTSLAD